MRGIGHGYSISGTMAPRRTRGGGKTPAAVDEAQGEHQYIVFPFGIIDDLILL